MSLLRKVRTAARVLREGGCPGLLQLACHRLDPVPRLLFGVLKSRSRFRLGGQTYPYCLGRYNRAWANERTVEVSVFSRWVRQQTGRVLEVGNVLSHYIPCRHDVVDLYEVMPGVINQDVVDFRPERPYDLIVSISTLEHVGYDEHPFEPGKPLRAIQNLLSCLAPGGTLAFSVPMGQNPYLDEILRAGRIPLDERYCLRRVGLLNRWVEVDFRTALSLPYDHAYRHANAILIGILRRPSA